MSSFFKSSDEPSASQIQPLSSQSSIVSTSSNITTSAPKPDFSASPFNKRDFKLRASSASKIYIIKYSLFTRTLLLIDLTKERQIQLQCTT